jgi:DNA primase
MLAAEMGIASVLDVVTQMFSIEGTERGDEYEMMCPHPAHDDARPSGSVNLITGLWHCFSCGRGGDLISLGSLVLGKSRADVEEALKPNTPEALLTILRGKLAHAARAVTPRKLPTVPAPELYADGPLDSLTERGFRLETLRRWGVRYVSSERLEGKKGSFNIFSSVAIPIRTDSGKLIAWCYRRTPQSADWQPRYLYTTGEELIRETWFGMDRHRNARDIVVVEGALDAMWCDQAGIPAVALLGSDMGRNKLLRLQGYRSVTLLGDRDAGGVAAVTRLGATLGTLVPLRVATYASWMRAADPQELSPVDLEIALERAKPWAEWVMGGAGRIGVRSGAR